MIKARVDDFLVCGLTDNNMQAIASGKPVTFNLKDVGLDDYEIGVFNGRSTEDMYVEISSLGKIDSSVTDDNGSIMVKVSGKELLLIGLTDENMNYLKENNALQFNLSKMDVGKVEILIFNGRTEEHMYMQLRDNISPVTTVIKGGLPNNRN